MKKVLFFAYGSLRRGFFNYDRFLKGSDHRLIGTGKTVKHFCLRTEPGSWLPVATKEELTPLVGDLYEIDTDTLRLLDRVEQHPTWYRREEVEVVVGDTTYTAWLYFIAASPNAVKRGCVLVKSGDLYDSPKAEQILNAYGRRLKKTMAACSTAGEAKD